MKSLECLNEKCINLLHKNKLLIPLIKAELTKSVLSSITIEEIKIQSKLEIFYKNLKLNNEEDRQSWMKANHLTMTDLKNLLIFDDRLDIYCQNNFDHKVESRFLERKNDLDIVVYSLIRVSDSDLASELYFRAVEREVDFGDLAAAYSTGIERKSRGIVGPISLSKSNPRLATILKSSNPGEIQLPVIIGDSYVIIRLETFDNAQLDSNMRKNMGRELFNEWIDSQINELKNNLLNANTEKESIGASL